jgi:hypothetical protein
MMKTNTIVHLLALVGLAFVLLLAVMPTSSAYAFEPPWPAGIPWPTTVPWPTANPLQIGVPWSPSQQTYPVYIPTPVPPVVQQPIYSAPAPLPPVAPQASAPTPLPPVMLPSYYAAPTPLPPISSQSYPSNPPPAVIPPAPVTYSGSTRSDALEPSDSFRTLNAGASVWYRIGTSGTHIDVWLEANPLGGVSMAIYAPNGSNQPIGRGTPDNSGRLVWSGGHWEGEGNWYAQITNSNPVAVQYRIQTSGRDVSNKSCYSYWEYIGTNRVYWTSCN